MKLSEHYTWKYVLNNTNEILILPLNYVLNES